MTEALVPIPQDDDRVTLGTLHAKSAEEMVKRATGMANALKAVVDDRGLYNMIQGRRYVRCEGWTTLATMLGVLPREVSNVAREDGAYEATVELVRMSDGVVLTRASAECGDKTDKVWHSRPRYARRSMAATRATGKACRLAFSWIMSLAGYEVTPAEEMDGVVDVPTKAPPPAEAVTDVGAETERPSGDGAPATQPQLRKIGALQNGLDMLDYELHRFMRETFGYESRKELTKADASELIEWLVDPKAVEATRSLWAGEVDG